MGIKLWGGEGLNRWAGLMFKGLMVGSVFCFERQVQKVQCVQWVQKVGTHFPFLAYLFYKKTSCL
jgi:hypothetical protein